MSDPFAIGAPSYDVGVVRTIAAAMGTPSESHDYVLTDTSTGRVRGVYATESLAWAAVARLAGSGGLYVLTVLHPRQCFCAVAA